GELGMSLFGCKRRSTAPPSVRSPAPPRYRPAVEVLARRNLMAALTVPVSFDFGTATSPVGTGYTPIVLSSYSPAAGFGWANTAGLTAGDSGLTDPVSRDFNAGHDATFLVDLPNGAYQVALTIGNPSLTAPRQDNVEVWVQGELRDTLSMSGGSQSSLTYVTGVDNGQLAVRIVNQGSADPDFYLCALSIQAATGPYARIISAPQTCNER